MLRSENHVSKMKIRWEEHEDTRQRESKTGTNLLELLRKKNSRATHKTKVVKYKPYSHLSVEQRAYYSV